MPSRASTDSRSFPRECPSLRWRLGIALGWERFADRTVSVDRFGASAPGAEVLRRLGITSAAVTRAVSELVGRRAQA
jgi:transketolase